MLIYKSFFRKKTTKIYILIITFIFLGIGAFLVGRQHYIKEGNVNYEQSYIEFYAKLSDYEKIKNLYNVKDVNIGLYREITSSNRNYKDTFYINNQVNEGEIFTDGYNENGFLTINNNNEMINFKIINNHNYNLKQPNYISQEDFDKLYQPNEYVAYRITTKNYFKREKTIKKIEETINYRKKETYDGVDYYGIRDRSISKSAIEMYEFYIMLFGLISIVLGIIFGIVLINTIINVIEDEKKVSNLLIHLGYNQKLTRKIKIHKILFLLVFPLILAITLLLIGILIW